MPETVTGKIFRIFFQTPDFSILKITTKEGYQSIKGNMRAVDINRYEQERKDVTFVGEWETHPKYGKQLKVSHYHEYSPATSGDINPATLAKFIAENVFNIGPVRAAQVVTNAGGCDELIDTIENHPEDLVRFHPFITAKDAASIAHAWESQKSRMRVLSFFADHGITGTFPHKIYEEYGEGAIETVKANPYLLIDEVENIGFKRADEFAMKLGFKRDSPIRIQAAIIYALQLACEQAGNCYLGYQDLLTQAKKVLGLSQLYVEVELKKMVDRDLLDSEDDITTSFEKIVVDDKRIYLKAFYETETSVAKYITEMLR